MPCPPSVPPLCHSLPSCPSLLSSLHPRAYTRDSSRLRQLSHKQVQECRPPKSPAPRIGQKTSVNKKSARERRAQVVLFLGAYSHRQSFIHIPPSPPRPITTNQALQLRSPGGNPAKAGCSLCEVEAGRECAFPSPHHPSFPSPGRTCSGNGGCGRRVDLEGHITRSAQ